MEGTLRDSMAIEEQQRQPIQRSALKQDHHRNLQQQQNQRQQQHNQRQQQQQEQEKTHQQKQRKQPEQQRPQSKRSLPRPAISTIPTPVVLPPRQPPPLLTAASPVHKLAPPSSSASFLGVSSTKGLVPGLVRPALNAQPLRQATTAADHSLESSIPWRPAIDSASAARPGQSQAPTTTTPLPVPRPLTGRVAIARGASLVDSGGDTVAADADLMLPGAISTLPMPSTAENTWNPPLDVGEGRGEYFLGGTGGGAATHGRNVLHSAAGEALGEMEAGGIDDALAKLRGSDGSSIRERAFSVVKDLRQGQQLSERGQIIGGTEGRSGEGRAFPSLRRSDAGARGREGLTLGWTPRTRLKGREPQTPHGNSSGEDPEEQADSIGEEEIEGREGGTNGGLSLVSIIAGDIVRAQRQEATARAREKQDQERVQSAASIAQAVISATRAISDEEGAHRMPTAAGKTVEKEVEEGSWARLEDYYTTEVKGARKPPVAGYLHSGIGRTEEETAGGQPTDSQGGGSSAEGLAVQKGSHRSCDLPSAVGPPLEPQVLPPSSLCRPTSEQARDESYHGQNHPDLWDSLLQSGPVAAGHSGHRLQGSRPAHLSDYESTGPTRGNELDVGRRDSCGSQPTDDDGGSDNRREGQFGRGVDYNNPSGRVFLGDEAENFLESDGQGRGVGSDGLGRRRMLAPSELQAQLSNELRLHDDLQGVELQAGELMAAQKLEKAFQETRVARMHLQRERVRSLCNTLICKVSNNTLGLPLR